MLEEFFTTLYAIVIENPTTYKTLQERIDTIQDNK